MSKAVDERVVEMRFDNSQFESNVKTSMSTLEKLKQSLKFTDVSKGLSGISSAIGKVSFSPMTKGIDTVNARLSSLQVIGMTALSNITTAAMNAGSTMVKALTIDPVKTGFEEYETQINAVQTILANTQGKGSTLNDVNRALDELNTYADKTIYNFTEMTRNIGTFTAAGVDLDKSVTSIKGIANLAAVSGSTSQQASVAMYQLSQALAAGKIQLMDWNSVVNAGMGGELFQNALKRTATQMGYNVDEMIEKYGSFRESLTKGEWLTADVLTETLTQLSGAYSEADLIAQGYSKEQAKEIAELATTAVDAATKVKTFTQLWDTLKEAAQSGWTQTWEIIVGDFEEAKELLTNVSDVVSNVLISSANARNEVLQGWKDLGGRTVLIDSFQNIFDGLLSIIKPVQEAFRDIFPQATSEQLYDATVKFKEFTESLKISQNVAFGLKVAFKNVFSFVETAISSLSRAFDVAQKAFSKVFPPASIKSIISFSDGFKTLAEFIDVDYYAAVKLRDIFTNAFTAINNVFTSLLNVVKAVGEAFIEVFPSSLGILDYISRFSEAIKNLSEYLKINDETAAKLKDTFKGVFSVIDMAISAIVSLVEGVVSLVGNFSGLGDIFLTVTSAIGNFLSSLRDGVQESKVFETVIGGIASVVGGVVSAFSNFGTSAFTELGSLFSGVGDIVVKVAGTIGNALKNVANGLSTIFEGADISSIMDAFSNGALAAVFLEIKKLIGGLNEFKSSGIDDFFDSIKDLGTKVTDTISGTLDAVRGSLQAWQANLKADTLFQIALAIGILAASLTVLSAIDKEALTNALGAITTMFLELVGALALLGKVSMSSGSMFAIPSMIGMALAILLLSGALKSLAGLNPDEIKNGVIGIAGLMLVLVAASKGLVAEKGTVTRGALTIIGFAAAIKILASVCKDLSELSVEELAKGLTGVSVLLAGLGIFTNKAKLGPGLMSSAVGILMMAAALKVLASACSDFGNMDIKVLIQGLVGIAAAVLGLAGVVYALDKIEGNVLKAAVSIAVMAAAIKLLADPIMQLGSLSIEGATAAVIGIAGALGSLVFVARTLPEKDLWTLAAVIPAISSSLNTVADALTKLGVLSFEQIGTGLVGIVGSIGTLVVAVRSLPDKDLAKLVVVLPALASSLVTVSEAFVRMSDISWEQLLASTASISAVIYSLVGAVKLLQGNAVGTVMLLLVSSALVILAAAITLIGRSGVVGAAASLIALAGSLMVIGAAAKLMRPLIPSIFSLSVSLAAFSVSLTLLGVGIASVGFGLLSLISGLAAALVAFKGVGLEGLAVGLAGLAGSFALIGVAGKLLQPLVPSIISLSTSIALLGLSCVAVSVSIFILVSSLESLGAIGAAGVADILTSLQALLTGILDMVPTLMSSLTEAVKSIILGICDVIATCAPQIANAILTVLTETIKSLADYGPQIVEFMLEFFVGIFDSLGKEAGSLADSLCTFIINAINGLSARMPEMVSAIANLFGSIFAGITESMGSFVGTVVAPIVEVFGNIFSSIVTAIAPYLPIISTTILGIVDTVSNAIVRIVEILAPYIPIITTVIAVIMDAVTQIADAVARVFEALAPQIPAICGMVAQIANAISTIVLGVLDAIEQIAQVVGDVVLGIVETLAPYIPDICDMIENVTTVVTDAVTTIIEALAPFIPNLEDIVWAAKDAIVAICDSFNTLVENIAPVIDSIKDLVKQLGDSISEIFDSISDTISTAGDTISEVLNSLEDTFDTVFNGISDIITSVGESISGVLDSISGIIESIGDAALDAGTGFEKLAGGVERITNLDLLDMGASLGAVADGLRKITKHADGLSSAGNGMKQIADSVKMSDDGLKSMSAGIARVKSELTGIGTAATSSMSVMRNSITSSATCFNLLKLAATSTSAGIRSAFASINASVLSFGNSFTKLSSAGVQAMNALARGIQGGRSIINTSLLAIVIMMQSLLSSRIAVFNSLGARLSSAFAAGIASGRGLAMAAVSSLTSSAAGALRSVYGSFHSSGVYVASGFASGIRSGIAAAAASAAAMASSASAAARANLKINSPSKVFREIGSGIPEGFILGIGMYRNDVRKSVESMGDEALDGAKNAMSLISQAFDEGVELSPTIRPVVDLSNVRSGSKSINELLGETVPYGAISNASIVSRSVNGIVQNGTMNDVVSAVDSLGKKLDNVSGNSYNINGITYDDGSNVAGAVQQLIRYSRIERRV